MAGYRHLLADLPGRLPAGWNLLLAQRVDSTNALARRLARSWTHEVRPSERLAVVAWEQTAGRGRAGRRWESAPGAGVWATLLMALPAERLALVPLAAPVGLCVALEPWLADRTALSWPNDLLVGGRKIGGLLVESYAATAGLRWVAVGLGVNLRRPKVEGASGLDELVVDPPKASELAAALLTGVERQVAGAGEAGTAAEAYARWIAHGPGDPLRCRTPAGEWRGRYAGLDERGRLLLETPEGRRSFSAAELIEDR